MGRLITAALILCAALVAARWMPADGFGAEITCAGRAPTAAERAAQACLPREVLP